MSEVWKSIEGYEGQYEVSSHGRVRSIPRIIKMSMTSKKTGRTTHYDYHHKGKMIAGTDNTHGYLCVLLSKKNIPTVKLVHRLVALAFIDNPENKPEVDHIDNVSRNNNVTNLRWCTRKENLQYASKMGILRERNNLQHLDYADAVEIRRLYASGEASQLKIAAMYNTTQPHVSNIVTFKTWITDTKSAVNGKRPHTAQYFSYKEAEKLRKMHATGNYTFVQVAKMFGISANHAASIVHNKAWVRNKVSRRTVAKSRRTVLDK